MRYLQLLVKNVTLLLVQDENLQSASVIYQFEFLRKTTVIIKPMDEINHKDANHNPDGHLAAKRERRYLPRWEVNNRVICRLDSTPEALECRSRDLSCAGIEIISQQSLQPRQKVNLTICLTETKALDVTGHVVWQRAASVGNISGVVFENVPQEIQDAILKYAFEFKKKDVINHWYEGWNNGKK